MAEMTKLKEEFEKLALHGKLNVASGLLELAAEEQKRDPKKAMSQLRLAQSIIHNVDNALTLLFLKSPL